MKIAVRAGHNYQSPGASGILSETSETRKVVQPLISYLRAQGHDVLDVTPGNCDVNKDLAYGVNKANSWGANLFVSIHFNKAYSSYDGAIGSEVLVYSSHEIAIRTMRKLAALGFGNRGVKVMPELYELRMTNMNSMIVETCFVEATKDAELYNSLGSDRVARAIAEGIIGRDIDNNDEQIKSFNISMFGHLQGGENVKSSGINNCKIGTVNQSLRLEAFQINIDGIEFEYMAHLQGYCDTQLMPKGSVLGTMGRGLRIEGFQINVTKIPKGYKLQYRANLQGIGLTNWVDSGSYCGTKNESRRLEMVEVRVIKG